MPGRFGWNWPIDSGENEIFKNVTDGQGTELIENDIWALSEEHMHIFKIWDISLVYSMLLWLEWLYYNLFVILFS